MPLSPFINNQLTPRYFSLSGAEFSHLPHSSIVDILDDEGKIIHFYFLIEGQHFNQIKVGFSKEKDALKQKLALKKLFKPEYIEKNF